jgi:hypothetical protein
MTIACLGWGSLIWNTGALPTAGTWQTDGPSVPVEFARQSDDGRMTLVIVDETRSVPVLWSGLASPDIASAKAALAAREGIGAQNIHRSIGFWTPRDRSSGVEVAAIGNWAARRELDGVVWTRLRARFSRSFRTPTIDEVIEYLETLEGDKRQRAETYVRRAPLQIRTAYRVEIERRLGWTPIDNAGG